MRQVVNGAERVRSRWGFWIKLFFIFFIIFIFIYIYIYNFGSEFLYGLHGINVLKLGYFIKNKKINTVNNNTNMVKITVVHCVISIDLA